MASESDAINKGEHRVGKRRASGRLSGDKKGGAGRGSSGRRNNDRLGAFGSMQWESSRVISKRTAGSISGRQRRSI
jgi:hypothetical protein